VVLINYRHQAIYCFAIAAPGVTHRQPENELAVSSFISFHKLVESRLIALMRGDHDLKWNCDNSIANSIVYFPTCFFMKAVCDELWCNRAYGRQSPLYRYLVLQRGNASDFGYSSVTVSYGQIEFDDSDADGNSLGINLSIEVGDSFFVFGSYGQAEIDDTFITADIDAYNLGVGFHMPLSDKIDLVTSLSYEYADISVPGFGSADDSGYGLGLGLRFAATEKFEINGGVNYVDFSDGGDDTSLGAGVLYNFTNSFSFGVAGNWNDDSTAYSVGGRFYFGR